jgi:2-oxoglutarate ferredoxin oxidoreductase subunit gamma
VGIPFTEIARKEIGKEMTANMVSLGAIVYLTKVVSLNKTKAALATRVPKKSVEVNSAALAAGIRAAKKVDLESLPSAIAPEEEEV